MHKHITRATVLWGEEAVEQRALLFPDLPHLPFLQSVPASGYDEYEGNAQSIRTGVVNKAFFF